MIKSLTGILANKTVNGSLISSVAKVLLFLHNLANCLLRSWNLSKKKGVKIYKVHAILFTLILLAFEHMYFKLLHLLCMLNNLISLI